MEASTFPILGIAGSLRRESFNARLLRSAGLLAPDGVELDEFGDLGAIPHFNQDSEGELTPASVLDLRDRIGRADALLIATPEFNSAMPGVLKNALDWASRPPGESVLAEKPAAAIGTSPGRFGARRAQAEVRKVLEAIGAEVLDRELAVPRAHEVFAEGAHLHDEEWVRELAAFMAALVELAGIPAPEPADSAVYSLACQRLADAA